MADAITIPSPSVFLAPTPPPTAQDAETAPDATKQPLSAKSRPTSRDQPIPSIEVKKKINRRSNSGPTSLLTSDGPTSSFETATFNSSTGNTTLVGANGKPKQSKSRNGCVTCKAKRLKCGEEKPTCQQCARRNVECGGYRKDFKWRPFEETNIKINMDKQSLKAAIVEPTAVAPSKGVASPAKKNIPRPPPLVRAKTSEDVRRDTKRSSPDADSGNDSPSSDNPPRPLKATRKRRDPTPELKISSPLKELPGLPIPPPQQMIMPLREASARLGQSPAPPPADLKSDPESPPARSPTLTEILLPFNEELRTPSDTFLDYGLPDDVKFDIPSPPPIDPLLTAMSPLTPLMPITPVNEITGRRPLFHNPRKPRHSRHSSSSSPRPDGTLAAFSGPVHYLYTQPFFAQDSPEMLSFRFDRLTCGILSIMDGPTENPWRTLVWPLAQQSPALYNAVMAMTAFHSSKDVPSLRVVGHEHKQASIQFISEGIRDSSMTDQMAIATALALGFAESWDQHHVTGNTHIKGAQALVKRAMENHQRDSLQGIELSRLKFLCNAWVFMDVLARLTSFDSDESNDFDNTFLFAPNAPQMVMGDSDNMGFGIDFGMPVDACLDPLMGCASTLFPLIGRVANLVRRVCRSNSNSPAIISQANDLKLALETWDPPEFIETPEDPTTEVQHTLQTAEAYRWATLLHLHQSVPELPSLSSADLAQRVLQYLATVPPASRTVVVQTYPLMIAGCEAVTTEDRQWVRERWNTMSQRMRLGVLDKCSIVAEEVWRRKDVYEAQPSARRRLVATAELQTARQRGQPLIRTDDGYSDADPGKTGMVFSYVEMEGDVKAEDKRPARPSRQDRTIGLMDPAYTVRGHLHWVGVMWDWGWEVLLK